MLAIPVHQREHLTSRRARTAFDGSAVAETLRVPDYGSTGLLRDGAGRIVRAIVDNDDLRIRMLGPRRSNDIADRLGLVLGRNDYG